jgi:hypothetical protein
MTNLFQKIFKKILPLTILAVCSCYKTSEDVNKSFLKQYGSDVQKINTIREASAQQQANSDCNSSPSACVNKQNKWKDPAQIFGINNSNTAQSANIDTSKITLPKPAEEFTPDAKTLMQGQSAQLPEDMFHISYNLYNFPESYGKPKISFDDINIPKQDAFGVRTELGEKNYQLIGNKTLQQDVDFTKQSISKEDNEISLELIKQEKQIRRKGKTKVNKTEEDINYVEIDKKDLTDTKKSKDNNDNKSSQDPLNNIINQVTDQISKTIGDTKAAIKNQGN